MVDSLWVFISVNIPTNHPMDVCYGSASHSNQPSQAIAEVNRVDPGVGRVQVGGSLEQEKNTARRRRRQKPRDFSKKREAVR